MEPINSRKPITSVRSIVEDKQGNIYTNFYTGVNVKEKGTDSFKDFYGTTLDKKDSESTYSLSVYKNRLIWDNIEIDINSGKIN